MGEKLEEKRKMRADIVSADSSTANISQCVMQNKNEVILCILFCNKKKKLSYTSF